MKMKIRLFKLLFCRDGIQYLDALNVMAYDYYWPVSIFDFFY